MDDVKHWLDWASILTILSTFMGWLPHIAALLSVIWTALRIYETRTVQEWLGRREK